jgi:hypothetical protein
METQDTPNVASSPDAIQHLALSDSTWSLWRWSALRTAGFPADYPLRLASLDCLTAADQLLQSERAVQTARQSLLACLNEAMEADATQRFFLAKIVQHIRKGKLPTVSGLPESVQDALSLLRQQIVRLAEHRVIYNDLFANAQLQATAQLHTLVQLDAFRQAITWQNHHALHSAIVPFLSKPPTASSSNDRKHRLLLARYLQRYCLKNDSIGFFGPIGWARWTPAQPALRMQHGAHLLDERHLYLESWAINALSQALTRRWPALLSWAIPRLMPFAHLDHATLHLPFVKPLPLSIAQAQVLARCDGTRTAQMLARELAAAQVPGLSHEDEVYAVLAQLQASRRITWSFDVPSEDPFPERTLRRRLEVISDPAMRTQALGMLEQLEQSVVAVRQAQTTEMLDAALAQVEQTFTALTDQAATRSAGQLYAGRTLVYEDCRRDVQIELGQPVLQGLEKPLELLLTSARWLRGALAQAFTRYCQEIYADLIGRQGAKDVVFTQFFPLVNATLEESSQTIFAPVVEQFQQMWARILEAPANQRQVGFVSEALEARVRQQFSAPGSEWPLGRYHCPDLMLAADSAEAINRGDFLYVLGELHLGMNTFDSPIFVFQHPRPNDLLQSIAGDIPEPRIVPVISQAFWPATRIHQIFAQPKDYRLVTAPEVCDAAPDHLLRSGDLLVSEQPGRLLVQTRDGRLTFPLLHVLGDYLSLAIGNCFALLPPLPHTPRITFDRVVVARETWRLAADQIPFAQLADTAESFLRVRQWADAQQMPRFLFYRTAGEKKPCFLDLASPLYVEMFVKEVRRVVSQGTEGVVVSLSEMLPTPEQAWLKDAQGARYTSEFRIAAVDRL